MPRFDRLDNIGGVTTTVEGNPRLVDTPLGTAIEFDGVDDAVFIDNHPLAGATEFTFEAAGGAKSKAKDMRLDWVPAKIAQEQLGHASISTTLGIYTHVVDASHRSAVEAVEDKLFVESVSNCLESDRRLEAAIPASNSVN